MFYKQGLQCFIKHCFINHLSALEEPPEQADLSENMPRHRTFWASGLRALRGLRALEDSEGF